MATEKPEGQRGLYTKEQLAWLNDKCKSKAHLRMLVQKRGDTNKKALKIDFGKQFHQKWPLPEIPNEDHQAKKKRLDCGLAGVSKTALDTEGLANTMESVLPGGHQGGLRDLSRQRTKRSASTHRGSRIEQGRRTSQQTRHPTQGLLSRRGIRWQGLRAQVRHAEPRGVTDPEGGNTGRGKGAKWLREREPEGRVVGQALQERHHQAQREEQHGWGRVLYTGQEGRRGQVRLRQVGVGRKALGNGVGSRHEWQ